MKNSTDRDANELCERGIAHFENGETEEALTLFEEAIRIDPCSPAAHNGRGVVLFSQGNVETALAEFNSAIQLDPRFAKAYSNRGVAFDSIGEMERALGDLNTAIILDSHLRPAFQARGTYFFHSEKYEAAISDFSRCIELQPDDGRAFAMRGLAHHYLGDIADALADYDEAIRLEPADAWMFHCRGSAFHAADDYQSAIADYDQSIRLDATNANSHLNRARAYLETEGFDQALSDLNESIRLDSNNADAYYYRASIWRERGDLQMAVDDLTSAILLDSAHRRAFKMRAAIWEELGELQKSDEDYERVMELDTGPFTGDQMTTHRKTTTYELLAKHFAPAGVDDITIMQRSFPARVRADLQRAIDKLLQADVTLLHFCGVRKQYKHEGVNFSDLLIHDRNDPALAVPPQYEEVDIGEEETVKCLKDGLWLLQEQEQNFALFLEPPSHFGWLEGLRFQIATINGDEGTALSQKFFKRLENAVLESRCYRGKILSLEHHERYSGTSTGVTVHRLKAVEKEQVILPQKTLELLQRNVIGFVRQRPRLAELGLATKKGLLFYGPPGTGKTHTIHFLAGALEGHTMLIITAEQVGLLEDYMTLARLLQPSVVVIEDVDLIARDRTEMQGGCEEVLLNKLLNEMDGLKQDADVLFILTTNRPEALEVALSARPGRIDQAIEFPLPDAEGREKLIKLYSRGAVVSSDVVSAIVKKTEHVSAAFIKELMRRAVQFHLERDDSPTIDMPDVESALDELLFSGGSLNRKLLGAMAHEIQSSE